MVKKGVFWALFHGFEAVINWICRVTELVNFGYFGQKSGFFGIFGVVGVLVGSETPYCRAGKKSGN